jgi:hypothetical protein
MEPPGGIDIADGHNLHRRMGQETVQQMAPLRPHSDESHHNPIVWDRPTRGGPDPRGQKTRAAIRVLALRNWRRFSWSWSYLDFCGYGERPICHAPPLSSTTDRYSRVAAGRYSDIAHLREAPLTSDDS